MGSIRGIWILQDKIALTADEEKTIELRMELLNGQERAVWNPSISIPRKKFEFTVVEVVQVKAAIETWNNYGAAADRRWLEPLLKDLVPAEPLRLPDGQTS